MSGIRRPKLHDQAAVALAGFFAAALLACSDGTGVRRVASVVVTPAATTLVVGDNVAFSARALDASGNVVQGRTVAWSASNAAVATVSEAGVVQAVGPGNASISATIDGEVGAAQIAVGVAPVSRVEVDPLTLSLAEGESRTLVARAFDASGRLLEGRDVAWMSHDPAIAEVDAAGRVVAKRVGTITVTATIEGRVAEITVTVTRAAVASIAGTPTALILTIGQTRQLTAIVLDAAGNRLTDRVVIWTTDAPDVARVSSSGLVSGTGTGYATITATCEGKTFSLAVTGQSAEPDIMPYDLIHDQ